MKLLRTLFKIAFVAILLTAAYAYRGTLLPFASGYIDAVSHVVKSKVKPCGEPVTYTLGNFDFRFNITREQLIAAAAKAANVWNQQAGRPILEYIDPSERKNVFDTVELNLQYDYRQEATHELEKISDVIDDKKSVYDNKKAQHDQLETQYKRDKASLDSLISRYEDLKASYEQKVAESNSRGGASKAEYEKLEQERAQLNAYVADINSAQQSLNKLITKLNASASELNSIAKNVNADVRVFNEVGQSAGEEFNEGLYSSDSKGVRINIYQFENEDKLVRLLIHEFGHALGLDHVNDAEGVMYRLNSGKSNRLTADDKAELAKTCWVQQ